MKIKVALAGAYGNLGSDIFKELIKKGHSVVALDINERDLGLTGDYCFHKIDVTDKSTLKGLFEW